LRIQDDDSAMPGCNARTRSQEGTDDLDNAIVYCGIAIQCLFVLPSGRMRQIVVFALACFTVASSAPSSRAMADGMAPCDSRDEDSFLSEVHGDIDVPHHGETLVSLVQYVDSVVMIRFFGSHAEYDKVDAENI